MKKHEIVVITGASAGVGRATAHAFAREGASVVLLARESPALAAAAEEVRTLGGYALPIAVDSADAGQIDAAAQQVENELGPIDIWINGAMTTVFAPVHEVTADEFRRATEVTYLGAVNGTLAALKHMRPRNRGMIVQIGSALAYRAVPLQAAYCGAKFAIRGFTDSLRVELRHERSGIHVTMVQLSAFNTPQFDWARTRMKKQPQPMPPIFQPEVAARGIHWAAHHHRRELIVGFPAFKAIFANKLLPSIADMYLAKKGYQGQLDDKPLPEDRPDNLDQPVNADYGTHGQFDSRSKDFSAHLWINTHQRVLAIAAGAAALATACTVARYRHRRNRS